MHRAPGPRIAAMEAVRGAIGDSPTAAANLSIASNEIKDVEKSQPKFYNAEEIITSEANFSSIMTP